MSSEKLKEDISKFASGFKQSPVYLEIGCGNGDIISSLTGSFYQLYGVEKDIDNFTHVYNTFKADNLMFVCGTSFRVPMNNYNVVVFGNNSEQIRQDTILALNRNILDDVFIFVYLNAGIYSVNEFCKKYYGDILVPIGEDGEAYAIAISSDKKKELIDIFEKESI